ncbi:MAG: haloalkane dehalogenase [Nitriliruptorales bacterium]
MSSHVELSRADVHGRAMAYREVGEGDPIVLLHGNPTSSYLWRNVLPHLAPLGRCIAPDLIGMGASGKLPDSGPGTYRFVEHRRYLDALLDHLGVQRDVTFVVHDWGSALGFDWANRHREAVSGIAYMEALPRPLTWEEWPEASRSIFEAMRSPAGEEICLEKNVFVERILPASVMRDLADDEMEAYRAPFLEPGEARRPTLTWPRELPIDGEPADVHDIVADYAGWLAESDVPKLYVRADPGFLTGVSDPSCRGWPNQTEATIRGIHFVQEDAPDEIGRAIADWIAAR